MEKFLTPTIQGHFLPEKKIDFKIFDGVAIPSSQFDATWK